jgi:hypothetical protein
MVDITLAVASGRPITREVYDEGRSGDRRDYEARGC